MSGFELEQNRGYSAVRFEPQLREMSWGDVEQDTKDVIARLKETQEDRLLVDLSQMEMIHSGLVAALVRIWKSIDGKDSKVVVVSPHEVVTEVLRSAGLFKLFDIAATREDAAYQLGVSPVAQMEKRERLVVAWAALPSALLALSALLPVFLHGNENVQGNAELISGLLAGFGCAAGIISLAMDHGWRRWLGLLAAVIGISVLLVLWFRRNPVNIPKDLPETSIQEGVLDPAAPNRFDRALQDDPDDSVPIEPKPDDQPTGRPETVD